MKALSNTEFASAIQKGLGRAFLHIKNHGDKGVREILLNACLHNLAYDPQCEGNKADWLFSMIEMTGQKEYYKKDILSTLPECLEDWDTYQMLDLAKLFAKQGDAKARRAIYAKLDSRKYWPVWIGGHQIIELDGLEGFLHVAEIVGARLKSEPDFWEDESMLSETKERFGEEAVLSALKQKSMESDNIKKYIEHLKIFNPKDKNELTTEAAIKYASLTEILEKIEAGEGTYGAQYRSFGHRATDEDLKIIYNLILNENRKEQLVRLLWVFGLRAMPDLSDKIFNYALHEDNELSDAAISALSNSKDEKAHKLALAFLNAPDWEKAANGIKLLINNYKQGDHKNIERIVERIPLSADIQKIHDVVYPIIQLSRKNTIPELTNILLWAYENSPCINCRVDAFKRMIELSTFPSDLLNECLYDSNKEVREIAEKKNKITQ